MHRGGDVIGRACGSFVACVGSLGLSVTALTGIFQLIAAIFAAVSGALTVWLLWKKVRAG